MKINKRGFAVAALLMFQVGQSAYAVGSCENGDGLPEMCVQLIGQIIEDANYDSDELPSTDEDTKIKCYRRSESIVGSDRANWTWNPEVYDATLKVRHFEVTADHSSYTKMVAFTDSGNRFWDESEENASKWFSSRGTYGFSISEYGRESEVQVFNIRGQYFIQKRETQYRYHTTWKREDYCLQVK